MKIEFWAIDQVVPFDLNSKKHDKEQVKKIAESIKKFGFDQPIVVDRDGVIIKGHGRRLACLELGLKTVPVLVREDLTPEQVRAARVADNRVAISDIDVNLLKQELEGIDINDLLTGIFDDKELSFLTDDLGEMNDSAFVTDLDAVVSEQQSRLDEKIVESSTKQVTLVKALGFKNVPSSGVLALTKMMAAIEAQTGLKEGEALVAFAQKFQKG